MRKTKIFIAEDIPSLNKGEVAILKGIINTLRTSLGDVEITLLSLLHPKIDIPRYSAEDIKIINGISDFHLPSLFKRSSFTKILIFGICAFQHILFLLLYTFLGLNAIRVMGREIWKEYFNSDLIIIGHDHTLLSFSHLYIIPFAKILRKPIVIYAGGASISGLNKVHALLVKILLKILLNKVDLILLREDDSYKFLKRIGIYRPPMYVTADVAFLLQPISHERVKEILLYEGIKEVNPIIGVTMNKKVLSHTFPHLKNKQKRYEMGIELMAQVIDHLIDTLNATIVFVPHSIGPTKEFDDRITAREIYQISKNKQRIRIISNEYTAEELKGLIGHFNLFIGTRIHSIISSTSMHVPSIAIAKFSDHRAHGIIGKMLGQQKWICYAETLDYDVLVSKIKEAWFMRNEIKRNLVSIIEIVKKRAFLNGYLVSSLLNATVCKSIHCFKNKVDQRRGEK